MSAMLLVRSLRDPASTLRLEAEGWNALIAMARAERLIGTLAVRLEGLALPDAVRSIMADALLDAARESRQALWEADRAARALAELDCRVVLLKGTAYAAAGLRPAEGRFIGDLDILVPRDALSQVEARLLAAGWEWVKADPYDDAYYRQWMHELPPLIHQERDRLIDVHHTVLPLTARQRPDAAAMIEAAQPIAIGLCHAEEASYDDMFPGEGRDPESPRPPFGTLGPGLRRGTVEAKSPDRRLYILSPEDRVCHAAAHLLADGDLQGGLRNLWDLHWLLRDADPAILAARAQRHGLSRHVAQARRLADALYGEGSRLTLWDRLVRARLLARDGWGRETRKLLVFAFYLRSHWLRMPPLMLARHLWTKWRKGHRPG